MINKAILCLNGIRTKLPNIDIPIYCTDGAYNSLKNYPILGVIGDMDSIEIEVPKEICYRVCDQNKTDFEKSLDLLIDKGFQSVDIYWGSGGEMDHFLGNLSVAAKYADQINIKFISDKQYYFYTKREISLNNVLNKLISIYPFPSVSLTSRGLQYELNNYQMNVWQQQSIRNKAILDEVELKDFVGSCFIFITSQ